MDGDPGFVTRAVVVNLDVTPSQDRLLQSYCGARRFAYNWAIAVVRDNLEQRRCEHAAGVSDDKLTPAVSWAAYSLGRLFNQVKGDVAPWWREVSMHALRSGINDAAAALKNFSDSRQGKRKGRPVGFPRFKKRGRSRDAVSFVEINHQLSWLHPDRTAVRLMLPQSTPDLDVRRRRAQLAWLHVTGGGRELRRLRRNVEGARATIQKVTVSKRGGRWQASFQMRYRLDGVPIAKPRRRHGGTIAVDTGVHHLATLSRPVSGVTDHKGHVANPRVLENQLARLRRLDRQIARCEKGSKNRARLLRRRARLHGQVTKTRALHLHHLSNALAGRFDLVGIEDLYLVGMSSKKRHLGRALADVALGELRRQFEYKCPDRGAALVVVDRFFPSSKTCSRCQAVKAKLPLHVRIFDCERCGLVLDRDVNAARNIAREAERLAGLHDTPEADEQVQEDTQQDLVAGLRPET